MTPPEPLILVRVFLAGKFNQRLGWSKVQIKDGDLVSGQQGTLWVSKISSGTHMGGDRTYCCLVVYIIAHVSLIRHVLEYFSCLST